MTERTSFMPGHRYAVTHHAGWEYQLDGTWHWCRFKRLIPVDASEAHNRGVALTAGVFVEYRVDPAGREVAAFRERPRQRKLAQVWTDQVVTTRKLGNTRTPTQEDAA